MAGGIQGIEYLLLTIPGVLIALTFHEFAHAWAANKLGDETPRVQGRLNLNPLSHIDPVGFIFLIVAGFGWGKPVQIDPRNFNGKHSISKAEAIVSVAGPIMNFILAFIFLIFTNLIFIYWPEAQEQYYLYITENVSFTSLGWPGLVFLIVQNIAVINIGLGIFNLIPLPPLDGSKVLIHFLPYNGKQWFYNNQQIFYILFLVLLLTDSISIMLMKLVNLVGSGMEWVVYNIFKLLTLI